MHNRSNGIKQWPLAGTLITTHGTQTTGPATVMFNALADGNGGWVSESARLVIRHEVRPTGEVMTHTGAPVLRIVSIDTLTGRETVMSERSSA